MTTIQATRKSTLPDLVKRMFDIGELNRGWMSDIYLPAHLRGLVVFLRGLRRSLASCAGLGYG
nr:hypothetical protein [Corynebacterium propinquum]